MPCAGHSAALISGVLCHKSATKESLTHDHRMVADLPAYDHNSQPVAGFRRNQYHEYRYQPRLGALFSQSLLAFEILKWAGAAYLVWLGIQQWRSAGGIDLDAVARAMPRRRLFKRAVLVNLTNPKSIVFLAALFPQFIQPHQPLFMQYLVLGVTTVVVDIIVMIGYATLATRIAGWIKGPKQMKLMNRIFGGLFMAVGALLASARKIA